jgi:hypothetical protein
MNNNLAEGWGQVTVAQQPSLETASLQNEMVDLNEVTKECVGAFEKELQALKAILRYDVLPYIKGSKEKMRVVFSNLLSSIIQHPPALTKLLVYLRCQKGVSETIDLTLPEGFTDYTISVYTNIFADSQWRQKNEHLINECAAALKSVGGQLECHTIVNTGCLYAMQIPGKQIE